MKSQIDCCAPERILPLASDLWVQASLDYKQRLQELLLPEGIAYDGNRFNRTAATAPLFTYVASSESADERWSAGPPPASCKWLLSSASRCRCSDGVAGAPEGAARAVANSGLACR
jgi:hypothetical protein